MASQHLVNDPTDLVNDPVALVNDGVIAIPPPDLWEYLPDFTSIDHRIVTRVDVLVNGVVDRVGLPVTGGRVDIDGSAVTRRRGSVTVVDEDGDLLPLISSDLLAPFGTELVLYRGVVEEEETLWPLGVFRIDDSTASFSPDGQTASLDLYDRSSTVQAADLEDSLVIPAGTNYGTAIADMLTTAFPAVVLNFTTVSHLTPLLVYETGDDPWEIAQEMAASIGMELFFNPVGAAVLRPVPIMGGVDPVVSYIHGEAGAFITLGVSMAGGALRNRWIRISTNKTPPFRAVATDDDPASPTRYGGPAGKRTDIERSDLYETQAQAQAAADAAKAANQGATQQASITALVDPRREAGDVVRVAHGPRGYEDIGIVESITIPLGADEAMSLTTRVRIG